MIVMQGDSYNLGILVLNNADNPVAPDDIKDLEITIGSLRKTYLDSELTFADGMWMFPLTQHETFRMSPGAVKAQVRVSWANNVIEGYPLYGIHVIEGKSKEVL